VPGLVLARESDLSGQDHYWVHLADWGEMYWGHQPISEALIEAHSEGV
jgi:hypothetical protein